MPPPPPDDFMNDDIDSYLIAMDTTVGPSPTGPPTTPLAESTRPKQPAAANHSARLSSEDEDETAASGRPPSKKVKYERK